MDVSDLLKMSKFEGNGSGLGVLLMFHCCVCVFLLFFLAAMATVTSFLPTSDIICRVCINDPAGDAGMLICPADSYLRLRERGLMAGERRPSSSVMLSELKCLVRKCSSSGVGWKGS